MKTYNKRCCICSQIQGEQENDLISTLLNEKLYTRRIILENESFAVIPSLGAITPGHLIICPKKHIKSFAQLDEGLEVDYYEIKEKISTILRKAYESDIHYFEHGTARNSSKVFCTVDHAHMHIIPCNVFIDSFLFKDFLWVKANNTISSLRNVVDNDEYIYYESPEEKIFVAKSTNEEFESQYMRKVFRLALKQNSDWNWRETPNAEEANEVYNLLKQN
ncbi:HIT domain-containing protein [uncultured Kriegella sp.]|uniref:HIT family protein n=1 Tax=uncultured Kriegella sp. TaxID=1798910 RepID=UPI0030DC6537|tara:strand:+ start:165721 stop:166380 length:660 start_codon:yes stop_codon:yes gene_type:complete